MNENFRYLKYYFAPSISELHVELHLYDAYKNKTYQSSVIFYPGFGSLAVVEGYMYMLLIIEYSAIYNAGTS